MKRLLIALVIALSLAIQLAQPALAAGNGSGRPGGGATTQGANF